jgi:predicted alpha/beta hydrolase family esterase
LEKKQILFIHSAGRQGPGLHDGSSDFRQFLAESLADYDFRSPLMPHPEAPSYKLWRDKFAEEFNRLDDGAILIGHSLGGSVILKFLSDQKIIKSLTGVFIVASPFWSADKDWQVSEYDLRENFGSYLPYTRYFFYQSQDDEVIPRAHFEKYSQAMPQATARLVNAGGHQVKDGLPELVSDITGL